MYFLSNKLLIFFRLELKSIQPNNSKQICVCIWLQKEGPVRDLNPGPLAPEARIIPLDQQAKTTFYENFYCFKY